MTNLDAGMQAIPLFALIVAIGGTHVLLIAWRAKERSKPLLLVAWGLVFGSFYLWTLTTASDKGVALGITAWVAIVLIYLLRQAFASPFRVKPIRSKSVTQSKTSTSSEINQRQIIGVIGMVMLLGPLAGLSAMVLATMLFVVASELGAEYTANLAVASILFPILWAGLAVLLAYQRRSLVRFMTVFGVGATSLLSLYVIV